MAGQLKVELGRRTYSIYCEAGLVKQTGLLLEPLKLPAPCLVVSNSTVAKLYWTGLKESLHNGGFKPQLALVPDGEEAKTLKVAAKLYDACLTAGIERKGAIIALGGGVVGDVTGFIAATWLRGVTFIQVPTTLLAQVDSSVGGKVALNHPRGKNLIGAFYQPAAVIADINTLTTLPLGEIQAGLAEVIKYGVIADASFFSYLEENLQGALAGRAEVLKAIVLRCCAVKADVVACDEREEGLRAILNYGHTVGHAIEAVTAYTTYRHGQAVAIGMVVAARLAVRRGIFPAAAAERLERLLKRAGLPVVMPNVDLQALQSALKHDKKSRQGRLRMVLPQQLGQVGLEAVSWEEIKAVID